jgi:predicted DNA binding protein
LVNKNKVNLTFSFESLHDKYPIKGKQKNTELNISFTVQRYMLSDLTTQEALVIDQSYKKGYLYWAGNQVRTLILALVSSNQARLL